jgi:ABC-type transport system involved in multi-copper enzyme maturation permease subunit
MAEPAALPAQPRAVRSRRDYSLVGPLFLYDVVRLARRGRSFYLRCVYALILYSTLRFAYADRFPHHNLRTSLFTSAAAVPVNEMARLAEGFVYSILVVQTAAVFILTPAYVAGAFADEKERRTLELLFTTHLTDREIVLGKLCSRLLHLGGVLLAGLPLLALTQLWGGVDFRLLLAAFLATGLNLFSIGGISIWCSAQARTVAGALVGSYAATAVAFVFFLTFAATPAAIFSRLTNAALSVGPQPVATTPLTYTALPREIFFFNVGTCCFINGLVIFLAIFSVIQTLRPAAGMPGGHALGGRGARTGLLAQPIQVRDLRDTSNRLPYRRRNLSLIGNWPLLWKETHRSDRKGLAEDVERLFESRWLVLAIVLAGVLCLLTIRTVLRLVDPAFVHLLNVAGQIGLVIAASGWCAMVAFRAAAGVSRERDAATLDGLLTLPMSRTEILGAKGLGPILYGRGIGYFLAGMLIAGSVGEVFLPLGTLILMVSLAAHLAFLASVGVWLSVASGTTLQARFIMAVVLLVFIGGGLAHFLVHEPKAVIVQSASPVAPRVDVPWRYLIAELGANAPGAWIFLSSLPVKNDLSTASFDALFNARLAVAASGAVAYGLATGALWLAAYYRFVKDMPR